MCRRDRLPARDDAAVHDGSWTPKVARMVVAAALVATAACASSHGSTESTRNTRSTRSTKSAPAPTTGAAATTTTTANKAAVTLAFAGDVHFEGPLRDALDANAATVLSAVAPVLRSYDITMVNLETAITERGTPAAKQYTFRAPPSALAALTDAGIDVATEANNHGVDYGPTGLADSLEARAHSPGVHVIGIGKDADDAYSPFRATVHGQRIAIIAATQVIDDELVQQWTATDDHGGVASAKDVPRLLAEVRAARATSDTVVVFLHWGVEGATCPSADQRAIARQLVAAGADIVVGSHSHRLEGAGFVGGGDDGFVDYGLGNFAFYTGTTSGVLTVTVSGRHVEHYGWVPAALVGGRPRPLTGGAATQATAAWQSLRACTDLDP